MKLYDVLDQKISKIRFNYTYEDGYGLQQFQSQIRLSNGKILLIPNVPDTEEDLTETYERRKASTFRKAKRCGLASRLLFKNKKIVDIHFKYLDNEPYEDSSCILVLDNDKFITENNSGTQGLTDIDLIIMDSDQYEEYKDEELEYRSLKNEILLIDLDKR